MARGKPDEETGVTPVSTDGEGADGGLDVTDAMKDELARRRQSREEPAAGNGGSIAGRGGQGSLDTGDEPETDEEDDGQMFVWERGRKVTLGTLIARGTAVEHAFVFGGKRTRGSGGLMAFGDKPLMIVRGGVGPLKLVPTYDADETVQKVTIEQHVTAKIVANADSDDGLALIAHVLHARGYVKSAGAA